MLSSLFLFGIVPSTWVFIFRDTDIFEVSRQIVLENLNVSAYFHMICFMLNIFNRNSTWLIPFTSLASHERSSTEMSVCPIIEDSDV